MRELTFGFFEVGDILGNAEGADDDAGVIAERDFGGEHPFSAAVLEDFQFGLGEDRVAGADDVLFVIEGGLGVIVGEEIEIRQADGLVGMIEAEFRGQGAGAFKEAGADVLKKDTVGEGIEHGAEQIAFISEGMFDAFAFGDVPEDALDTEGLAG